VDPFGIEKPFTEAAAVRCSYSDFPTVEVELHVLIFLTAIFVVQSLSLSLRCFVDPELSTMLTGVRI
jgi:hypothetical protein